MKIILKNAAIEEEGNNRIALKESACHQEARFRARVRFQLALSFF